MDEKVVLSVLIPVRNEPEGITIIVKVLKALIEVPHELLIITDNQKDSTIPFIQFLCRQFPNVKHIENTNKRGVLNAIKAGVSASQGEYIMIYAADEVGPVLAISQMLQLMNRGCDLVSGTRYAKGGKRYGGSRIGHFLSRVANRLFGLMTSTELSDCTTGLKMFRADIFPKFSFVSAGTGWSFAFDMSIEAQVLRLKIGEVPIVSIDRLFGGKSSMKLMPWICAYFKCFIRGMKELPPWRSSTPCMQVCENE